MNVLPRDKQIEVISGLTEGLGIRAAARITGVNRGRVASLVLRVGRGCAELHERLMVGLRVNLIECDELWSYVLRKRRWHEKPSADAPVTGDQYTIALGASSRAIISSLTAKRSTEAADQFIQDLRQRVIGSSQQLRQIGDVRGDAPRGWGIMPG
jgi:hypothetical protein